jgi:steroid delta-isomerase-like uncharacterized protein
MTRNEIDALLARHTQAWARLDAAALAQDHADDAVVESPLAGGTTRGRAAIERLYETYFDAFSDLTIAQEDLVVEGDTVAMLVRLSGTDDGGFMGMEPTGRRVEVAMALFFELRDGAIVRERRVYDFTSVLLQVGALKAKPG